APVGSGRGLRAARARHSAHRRRGAGSVQGPDRELQDPAPRHLRRRLSDDQLGEDPEGEAARGGPEAPAARVRYDAPRPGHPARDIRIPEELTMRKILKGLALVVVGALAALTVTGAAHAQKKTLVVALNQDPDILDPTLARTYVGRIIFSQMCEKLYEIDEGLRIQPQLAAALPTITDGGRTVTIKLRSGVKFNDGTPMDAEAVKFSLERHRTLKGSNRASELAPVEATEVVDPLTVRLRLKAPFSPLVAQLTDRAGMPLSPTAVNKLGEKFGTAPVCVGPWQFAERVAQDRIVVERSTHYFDPGQAKFDKIIFRIIADDNVRLANLRSGDIDVMHQVSPTDATGIKREGKFELS